MLINIILILSLVNFFARRDVLGCGLVAFSGKQAPDPLKLLILSLFNEDRGRHSCGIANDFDIRWGTSDTDKLISDFKLNHKYTFDKSNTVMIHMRHATSGGKEHAHPFGFRRNKNGEVIINQKGHYDMIGMHNGTITNWTEIKEKYNLGTWAIMDSKTILGAIYEQESFNPLSDYEGAAALIFQDVARDLLYIYKGVDLLNKPERTLYRGETKEGIYFSSLEKPLRYFCENVEEVPGNTVITYDKGEVVEELPIKRKKPFRTKEVVRPSNTRYTDDDDPRSVVRLVDVLYPYKNRYYVNGMKLNGRVHIDPTTLKVSSSGNDPSWFIDGIEVEDWEHYSKWSAAMTRAINKKEEIDFQEFSKSFTHPACVGKYDDSAVMFKNYEPDVYYLGGEKYTEPYSAFPYTFHFCDFDDEGFLIPSETEQMDFEDALWWWKEEFFDLVKEYKHVLPLLDERKKELLKEIDLVISNLVLDDEVSRNSIGETSPQS